MGELIAESELRDMVSLEDDGSSEHIIFRGSHDCLGVDGRKQGRSKYGAKGGK